MEFYEHLQKEYDTNTVKKLQEEENKQRTYCVILNENKYNENVIKDKIIEKHPFVKNGYYIDKNIGYDYLFSNGVYYYQDAGSMMAAYFLIPNENDIILDMCAAPGGKTIDIALKLKNKGLIISNDVNYSRAKTLSNNIENLGFANVFVTCNDLDKIKNFYKYTFDKIILDAPCSGSFMFRKNEEALKDWSIEKVKKYAIEQEKLLEIADILLKEDGILYYSTCSLSKEENEYQIQNFLKNHPGEYELIELNSENKFYDGINNTGIYMMPFMYKCEGQYICILKKVCKTPLFFAKNSYFNKNNLLEDINLKFKYETDEGVYLFNNHLNMKYFNTLRYGLKLYDIYNKKITPSLSLSRYLDNLNSIKLDENQFLKYIKGEILTFSNDIKIKDGFNIVSYNGINLGFVKVKNNIAKNLYPKKLRI